MGTKSLDLGCGSFPKNLFGAAEVYGIDIREDLSKNIIKADLILEKIPFDNEVFDYVTAHDFLEHIPRLIYAPDRKNPFIDLMNEVWRILKPGDKFLSVTPAYPHAAAFQDPTHVNIITEKTFTKYFDDQYIWARMYGFVGSFSIEMQTWRDEHLWTIMQKK